MPIALLLPLIPVLVESVMKLVEGLRQSPELTADQKALLATLAARLEETNAAVQDLDIRDV